MFGYSDEDGTEAVAFDGKVDEDVIAERVDRLSSLAHELCSQRAEDRVGTTVEVLVEDVLTDEDDEIVGRAAHQGPEVDGVVRLLGDGARGLERGDLVPARGARHRGHRPAGRGDGTGPVTRP